MTYYICNEYFLQDDVTLYYLDRNKNQYMYNIV